MQLIDIPFRQLSRHDTPRPWMPVIIINPHANKRITVLALIDTGADECAIPASYAPLLGHDLLAGQVKQVKTGNGLTTAYSHTTSIEVGSFTAQNVLIDFMPNLHVVLLGAKSFLSHFILTIDYPRKSFSLATPAR